MLKQRNSNLELFRIILMLIIIAHHYVVNSGVTRMFDFNTLSLKIVFLQFFGFGGKCAINCFLLITGYYMIKSKWKLEKMISLMVDILFYKIFMFLCMVAVGFDHLNLSRFLDVIFWFVPSLIAGRSFPEVFLAFFILIPFVNKLIFSMNKREITYLLTYLLTYYVFLYTIWPNAKSSIHYIGWFVTVYLVGAYVRLYQPIAFNSKKKCLLGLIISLVFALISIFVIDIMRVSNVFGVKNYYYFVIDSNKIGALILSVYAFMYFKTISIKYNKFINWVAASTLPVLLIHANSKAVIKFLWEYLINVKGHYQSENIVIYSIISVISVYVVCVSIDKIIQSTILYKIKRLLG